MRQDGPVTTEPTNASEPAGELPAEVPEGIRDEWAELAEQATAAQFAYHVRDAPTISDGQYDALIRRLVSFERAAECAS